MSETVNPKFLELARHLRQYTQKEAAELLGVSQGKLSKAEKGLQPLPSDIIENLQTVFNLPLSFFYQSTDASQVGHLYYRRQMSIPAKVLDALDAQIRVQKMAIDQMFDAIELPEFDWQFEQPSDELTPAEIARRTRYSLGLHRGAIGNLTVLLEDHGVIIQKMDFGTEKMDGLTSITDRGRRVIFLNTRMPNDRMRFSLAHELGHLIMHLSFVPKHPESVEDEANEFASEFLMPEAEIKSSLKRITLPILGNLKQQWGVSMRALIRRARDLQMIDDKIYRNYQIIFSKKGYNKREPIHLPYERSNMVQDVVELYKTELGYSDEDLSSISNLLPDDFKRWFILNNSPIFSFNPTISTFRRN